MPDEHTPEQDAQPLERQADDARSTEASEAVVSDEVVSASADVPVEPASSEQPQAVPAVPTPLGPEPATVPAGSRVTLIVSSGPSPAPPSIPVEMPDVVGEQQGAALLRLQAAGFGSRVLHDYNDTLPRGYVTGQYPMPGASVIPGSDAVLVVSAGRAQLPAPDVMLPSATGLDQTLAAERLIAAGLVPRVVQDFDPVAQPGLVIAQIPSEEALSTPLHKRGSKAWLVAVAVLVTIALVAGVVWYLNRPTTVPNLIGLPQMQAESLVEQAGFRLGSVATSQTTDEKQIGNVVGQAPSPGGTAAHGSTLNLVVAGGQLLAAVPNVVGAAQGAAIKSLQDAGFAFEVSQSYSSTVPSGSTIAQAPTAGERIPPGTTVGLNISLGAHTITVPNVVGQVKTTAETSLKGSGLGVATASNYDTATPAGQVMAQQPTVGTGVVPGTTVGLTVSLGPPTLGTATTAVPNVVGKTQSKAQSALKKRNLKYLVAPRPGSGRAKGVVVAQLPDVGAVIPRNSVVIIFVSDGS